jgi:hypothetical protein
MQALSAMDAKKKQGRRPKNGAQSKVVVRTARTDSGAVAVHANLGPTHAVAIGDLRVMIVRDGEDSWFARGLEIDFAEQGSSLEDVQERFEKSLTETIREHLNVRGNIRELLRFAPSEVLQEYYDAAAGEQFQLECVAATRLLPDPVERTNGRRQEPAVPFFDKIQYLSQMVEAQP